MYYQLYQNNIKNSTGYLKYYAKPAPGHTMEIKDLAAEIERNCTAKHSDVVAVLTELQEVMQNTLKRGDAVKLEGIGTFKIGFHSAGVNIPGDFKPAEHIKSVYINFQQSWTRSAGQPVKKLLTEGVRFEKMPVNKL